jgi:hypothetical protein
MLGLLMTIIPKNIEASMFSVVTACVMFGTLWGGQVSAAIVYEILGLT